MADEGAMSSGENPVGYQLDANRDVDLQKPGARVGHGVQSEPNEAAAGQAVALSEIKSLTGLSLAITDFEVSVRERNIRTGKWNEPVEWTATRDGKSRGEPGVWTIELNLDDPDPAHVSPLSPTRPHVGYTAIFFGAARRVIIGRKATSWSLASMPPGRQCPCGRRQNGNIRAVTPPKLIASSTSISLGAANRCPAP